MTTTIRHLPNVLDLNTLWTYNVDITPKSVSIFNKLFYNYFNVCLFVCVNGWQIIEIKSSTKLSNLISICLVGKFFSSMSLLPPSFICVWRLKFVAHHVSVCSHSWQWFQHIYAKLCCVYCHFVFLLKIMNAMFPLTKRMHEMMLMTREINNWSYQLIIALPSAFCLFSYIFLWLLEHQQFNVVLLFNDYIFQW